MKLASFNLILVNHINVSIQYELKSRLIYVFNSVHQRLVELSKANTTMN